METHPPSLGPAGRGNQVGTVGCVPSPNEAICTTGVDPDPSAVAFASASTLPLPLPCPALPIDLLDSAL
jgi:hypothetical protein